jgi:uncharacterized protein (UPF0264 family)
VSVRHAGEVAAALEGGADIIDAKEPSRGALGPLHPEDFERIAARVPSAVPLSAALGDPAHIGDALRLLALLPSRPRTAPTYVKLGFAGLAGGADAQGLLAATVSAAAGHPLSPSVIAVTYADGSGPSANLEGIAAMAAAAGAAGVLVDTIRKDRGSLPDVVDQARLRVWMAGTRRLGLLVALAGRLTALHMGWAAGLGADVVGVRGAACVGGREGTVSAVRVRRLRAALGAGGDRERPLADHETYPLPIPGSNLSSPIGTIA